MAPSVTRWSRLTGREAPTCLLARTISSKETASVGWSSAIRRRPWSETCSKFRGAGSWLVGRRGRLQPARIAELAVGLDATIDPSEPTIFGDVQFGNWALAYRDLMRLLDADIQLDVDLYVYITGDETLSSQLSEGIA